MYTTLLLLTLVASQPAAGENPFRDAKVGDWVEYRTDIKLPTGQQMATSMKQTVTAKSPKEVTLKIEMKAGGRAMPGQTVKLPLDKPFDPGSMMGPPGMKPPTDAKFEEQGEETLTIAKKKLNCKCMKVKNKAEVGGQKIETEARIWICPDVPLGGLVRMESETRGQQVKMEAVAWGRGK